MKSTIVGELHGAEHAPRPRRRRAHRWRGEPERGGFGALATQSLAPAGDELRRGGVPAAADAAPLRGVGGVPPRKEAKMHLRQSLKKPSRADRNGSHSSS